MRKLIGVVALVGILALAIACETQAEKPEGVLIPFPEKGNEYRMSELCLHLQTQGYDVRGTIDHTIDGESIAGLLTDVPGTGSKGGRGRHWRGHRRATRIQ